MLENAFLFRKTDDKKIVIVAFFIDYQIEIFLFELDELCIKIDNFNEFIIDFFCIVDVLNFDRDNFKFNDFEFVFHFIINRFNINQTIVLNLELFREIVIIVENFQKTISIDT